MCGHYVRKSDKQKIAEHSAVHGPSLHDFGPSWNVAPQTFQPIVRLNRDTGDRHDAVGTHPYWAKDPSIGLPTINAKAETITTAPAFRVAVKYRRCLVPGWRRVSAFANFTRETPSMSASYLQYIYGKPSHPDERQ